MLDYSGLRAKLRGEEPPPWWWEWKSSNVHRIAQNDGLLKCALMKGHATLPRPKHKLTSGIQVGEFPPFRAL